MVTMTISLVRKSCQKPRLSEVVPAPLRIPSLVSSVARWIARGSGGTIPFQGRRVTSVVSRDLLDGINMNFYIMWGFP